MKYLALTLILIANAAYADTQSTIAMDKINSEVNQQFSLIPSNSFILAREKQRRLLKQGIESEIIVIKPLLSSKKHAVLCVDDQCIDNGDISYYIFNKDELRYFGRRVL